MQDISSGIIVATCFAAHLHVLEQFDGPNDPARHLLAPLPSGWA